MRSSPVAVLISDVHFSLANLELAKAAMTQAIKKANSLDVPLIVAGDLHDTKANLRGECVNAMISIFELCDTMPWVLVGNHDKINEKSLDNSLGFLAPYAHIVDEPIRLSAADLRCGAYLIPYQHDTEALKQYLSSAPKKLLIMHQGIQGSNMGDYIQDRSALSIEDVAGFRVISGHYHARQTIDLPDGGKWDYIGSPYTMSYGESNDPPKGFQVLMEDGSLQFVPTDLRKHVIADIHVSSADAFLGSIMINSAYINSDDLLWIKVRGTKEELAGVTKEKLKTSLNLDMDFRLDHIPAETTSQVLTTKISSSEILDGIIDSLTNTSEERKARLKSAWKNLV